MPRGRVLVTGGSGFIAGHCILQLLEAGYEVRTTLRSLTGEANVRSVLGEAGMVNGQNLAFTEADLTGDAGWAEATAGIEYVLHVASPVQPGHVADENDLIVPAREGTLRVLRAARDAGVTRVVLTSAFHAVSWGHPHDDHVFTERDWTIVDGSGVDAYGKSKTLAERSAWEFVQTSGGRMELTTMLPVAVMGPVLGHKLSGSNHLIQRILNGDMPGFPHLFFPIVDVRDVAKAHILAMTNPAVGGERFLLSNGPAVEMKDIGALIRSRFGPAAKKVPRRTLPDVVVRVGALFNPELKSLVPELGYRKNSSNEKARKILGWAPRDPEDAIVAAAESMIDKGLAGA
ncbi:epimerase [Mycolicibacterium aromaticivorans JS19b1 = JCM 16368]|uniref:Epimerase n=1 Tax=Mycolicibacterium aromaticivorans JS19b1 = JCM 16368 TaxID=1440774 RepID=A0A064CDK9_9MYCO|nr:aldehyde reductase [Mycolicibacterium aromaticivorans]KDE98729.1 epimerase [Mycolicibacterium aromaticivorans JS19b1 = JCM 16368]